MSKQLASFLLESDTVSLSKDLVLEDYKLFDTATGAHHKLHPDAVFIISQLGSEITAKDLYASCYKQSIIPDRTTEFIYFLNDIGGLVLKRRLSAQVTCLGLQLRKFILGIPLVIASKRFRTTRAELIRSVTETILPVVLAASITGYLLYATGLDVVTSLTYYLTFVISLYLSVMLHELSHLWLIKKYTQAKGIIIKKGLRLAIIHETLPRKREVQCALLGPATGVFTCVTLTSIVAASLHNSSLVIVGTIVALVHLLALLPSYSDGKVIWKASTSIGSAAM